MKTILFTITLTLLGINFSQAQEKQNDATIEETIAWINQYGFAAAIPTTASCCEEISNIWFDESSNELKYTYTESEYYEGPRTLKISYDNAYLTVDKHRLIDNTFEVRLIEPYDVYYTIMFNKKEIAERVYKAFEHLFFLLEWNVTCRNKLVSENKF